MTEHSKKENSNPLGEWMRHPEIYITLPSNGNFVKPGNYTFSVDGQIGVAPMTAADEIILKSPEGLLNGESIAKVISSCVPGIDDVFVVPAPDIDVLLLAIRLVSYGNEMDFEVTCPKCKHQGTYSTSLRDALSSIQTLEKEYPVELSNGVIVYVRPFTYADSVKEAIQKYHESQALRLLNDSDMNDIDKAKKYTESVQKIANLVVELCVGCIIKIVDPNGKEIKASKDDILEWGNNLPRGDAEKITSKINEINSIGVNKQTHIKCSNCEHEWDTELSFDPSHFFV